MTSYLRGRTVPVLLATAALVGAANLGAYAATGHPLLLGGQNHAATTTTVTTSGRAPALTLHTSKKAPPLAVSSDKRVKHLNADRVDGLDAADLGSRAITYRLPNGPTGDSLRLPPPGTYLMSVSVTLAAADPSGCFVEEIGGAAEVPLSINGTVSGGLTTVSGSTVLTLSKKVQDLNFRCFSPIYDDKGYSSTVALVRIPTHAKGRILTRTH
jgi:hypothetical protein